MDDRRFGGKFDISKRFGRKKYVNGTATQTKKTATVTKNKGSNTVVGDSTFVPVCVRKDGTKGASRSKTNPVPASKSVKSKAVPVCINNCVCAPPNQLTSWMPPLQDQPPIGQNVGTQHSMQHSMQQTLSQSSGSRIPRPGSVFENVSLVGQRAEHPDKRQLSQLRQLRVPATPNMRLPDPLQRSGILLSHQPFFIIRAVRLMSDPALVREYPDIMQRYKAIVETTYDMAFIHCGSCRSVVLELHRVAVHA